MNRQKMGSKDMSLDQGEVVPEADSSAGQIVFVGSTHRFSNAFLRTVQYEIKNLSSWRLERIEELSEHLRSCTQRTWLVVLESSILRDVDNIPAFVDNLRNTLAQTRFPAPQVAIACETDSCRNLERAAAAQMLMEHRHLEGFRGILPLSRPVDVWLEILRLFLSRGSYYPPELFSSLLKSEAANETRYGESRATHHASHQVVRKLTRRENEVLELVASGLQNKQIAAGLSLSEHTVKLHIHNVISKLEVKNRTEAAALFLNGSRLI